MIDILEEAGEVIAAAERERSSGKTAWRMLCHNCGYKDIIYSPSPNLIPAFMPCPICG